MGQNSKTSFAARFLRSGHSSFLQACRNIISPYRFRNYRKLCIHFGCGEIRDQRFFNVDARPFQHVHYATSSPFMPALPRQSAKLIYACHAFEHISYRDQLKVLNRWRELLEPGGEIMLSVPDFSKVIDAYRNGRVRFEQIQGVLMGEQNYPGNFHYALFTAEHLTAVLGKAGFSNIREWSPGELENWPRDWSWADKISLNLKAEKP